MTTENVLEVEDVQVADRVKVGGQDLLAIWLGEKAFDDDLKDAMIGVYGL
ncbi:MAG: hypothetical protein Q9N67_11790 [Ghiorsea sp.]|nr:hypothetical protein [Ghiorsea sp.]